MTFPGAGAQVYYNEAGEPTGWDYPSYDDGPDPDDFYDSCDDEPDEGDGEGRDEESEDPNERANRLVATLEAQGLKVRHFGENGVINVTTPGREITSSDAETVRATLREYGFVEVESWIATQGASWLSDGVFAGVSFKVRPAS